MPLRESLVCANSYFLHQFILFKKKEILHTVSTGISIIDILPPSHHLAAIVHKKGNSSQ